MDWSSWLALSPEAFARKLRRRLTRPIRRNDFIELYNQLMSLMPEDAQRIGAVGDALAALLEKSGRRSDALDMLELAARAHFHRRDAPSGFKRLEAMIRLDAAGAKPAVLELARDLLEDSGMFGASIDQRPETLASLARIFERYEAFEEVVEIHRNAAMIYSRHGAWQSAYRSLVEAEQIARRLRSPALLAKSLCSGLVVGFEEGDSDYALRCGTRALRISRRFGLEIPTMLLSNLGLTYLNRDMPEQGARMFEEALAAVKVEGNVRGALHTNLAAAYRRLRRYDEAAAELAMAEGLFKDDDWPEHRLELELGHARLAADTGDAPTLVEKLGKAAHGLDAMLRSVLRLHHRRGIRERYLNHLERLMGTLPDRGRAEDVLAPLVAVRGNALADWLAVLAWADGVRVSDAVEQGLKNELVAALGALRNFGAPHLYGFREKYDDAWSAINGGTRWDQLSNITARLPETEPMPMAAAEVPFGIALLRKRLDNGHALMVTTQAAETACLWLLLGDSYHRVAVDRQVLFAWKLALQQYAVRQIDRSEFSVALAAFTDQYRTVLDPLLDKVAAEGCRSIRYIPDYSDPPPLAGLASLNPILRERMLAGDFEVRIVPAIHAPTDAGTMPIATLVAMHDPDETLRLPRFEGPAMAKAAGASLRVATTDDRTLAELVGEADALLVSTHGPALGGFSDAFFARLGSVNGRHPVSVEALQHDAPDLALRLVLLNACHSATGSGRNYQQQFRTSDVVTLPGLFLMNRLAVAGGNAWPVTDTAAYLFAVLTGRALAAGHGPAQALTVAAGQLRGLRTTEAVAMISEVEDEVLRGEALARLANAPAEGAFSHPFISGGLSIYGLL